MTKPRGKICKMQYVDFNELQDRNEFAAAIKTCDRFQLTDIMSFRYDWNREILAQFHATYFWNMDEDEIHWMTDGRHYRIDFVTFCRILGFGQIHRSFSRIHDVRRLEPHEVSFMWEDPSKADGRRTGLKAIYYTMNNLFRITLNPKDNATDLNGYITNVLSRFPDGERFNVGRFIWVELAYAMDDGRRSLPYAPYLMFMIKRLSGQRFPKDCIHGVYNIKKTHGGKGSSGAAAGSTTREASFAHRDVPESSRNGRKKKSKKLGKMSEWIKAIFATCTYAANTAYEDRLENREAVRAARELAGLPPLAPVRPPPQFPNLPSLSDTSSEDEQPHGDAQEQHFEQPDGDDSDDEGIRAAKEDP
jgi:hypothetical protein